MLIFAQLVVTGGKTPEDCRGASKWSASNSTTWGFARTLNLWLYAIFRNKNDLLHILRLTTSESSIRSKIWLHPPNSLKNRLNVIESQFEGAEHNKRSSPGSFIGFQILKLLFWSLLPVRLSVQGAKIAADVHTAIGNMAKRIVA